MIVPSIIAFFVGLYIGRFNLFTGIGFAVITYVITSMIARNRSSQKAYEFAEGSGYSNFGDFINAYHYNRRDQVFWIALTSLVVGMAKADGQISNNEIRVYDKYLSSLGLNTAKRQQIASIFNQLKNQPINHLQFAEDIYNMYYHAPNLLESILILLMEIAKADGRVHPNEERFINNIAFVFHFSQYDIDRLKHFSFGRGATTQVSEIDKSYKILGITNNASVEEIKSVYRKLIKENHPDRLMAEGYPPELIDKANEKMKEINRAYETVMKARSA